MYISISNFGPIKEYKCDLEKDLIITYGMNNIGKSYAISAIYLVIKAFMNHRVPYFYMRKFYDTESKIDGLAADILKKAKTDPTDVTNEFNNYFSNSFSMIFSEVIENSFYNTFGNIKDLVNESGDIPKIRIKQHDLILELIFDEKVTFNIIESATTFSVIKKDKSKKIKRNGKFHLHVSDNTSENMEIIRGISNQTLTEYLKILQYSVDDIYFLPASRSGIYTGMGAFSQIFAQLSKSRSYITKKIEIPALSEPVSDYYIQLTEIENSMFSRNQKMKDNLIDIAETIENEILDGSVRFDAKKKQIMYRSNKANKEFELNKVSSMVSEISPIVAYLKYVIGSVPQGKTVIIFIEEPEAHLHPSAQVKLIEMLSKLAKRGVKLVITSHSNYIFNKLNNLILSKDVDHTKYSPILLEKCPTGSCSTEMKITELGVWDSNFTSITEELFDEREDIISSWGEDR